MKIKNIEGLSGEQIRGMVAQGGKFVTYKYCISIVVMTFNNNTNIHFIRPGKSSVVPGIGPLFTNLFLGWWGIPWGPIYTIGNISRIFMGGKEVTDEIMAHINQNDPSYGQGNSYNIPGTNPSSNNASGNPYNIPRGDNDQSNNNTYNIPRS
jgi:hypothetical protein